MIKIYDEIQYIEDFVKGDFLDTPHWIYDISIYVRWKYKDCHNKKKKKKIREELVKKCQKSFPWFNINIHYKIIDEVIKEINPDGMKGMGLVIKAVKEKCGVSADMTYVSKTVKEKLSNL